jgi:hypothetical protein
MAPRRKRSIIRTACGPDYRSLCQGVSIGGGRAIGCLRDHAQDLSSECRSALRAAAGR